MATLLPVGHLNLKNKVNIKQSKKNEYPKQVATPHIMHAAAMTITVYHSHVRKLNISFVHNYVHVQCTLYSVQLLITT